MRRYRKVRRRPMRRRPIAKRPIRRKRFIRRKGRRIHQKGLTDVVRAGAYGATAIAGYVGSRRGSASAPVSRSKVIKDPNSYFQWEQFRFKRRLGKLTQRKLNYLSMDTFTMFWRALDNLDVGQGKLWMYNAYNGTPNQHFLPLYLIDLTSSNNVSSGAPTNISPVLRMTRSGTSNSYTWVPVSGVRGDGTTADTVWQFERTSPTGTVGIYPNENSILKWADVRMDLFGCKSQPTKFVVELCQLDEDVCPESHLQTPGTMTDLNAVRFWDQQIRSFIYNPNFSQPQFGGDVRKKKVIDSRVIEISPTSTTESDQDPHIKTLQLFYRLNRRCKYNWKDSLLGNEVVANSLMNTSAMFGLNGDNQLSVHPRARLFIMIRAVKFVKNALISESSTVDTPSFNLQLRTKHIISM